MSISIFWFRRDLRLDDNAGLYHALKQKNPVRPIFIFDRTILDKLDSHDRRVAFIHRRVCGLKKQLHQLGSDLQIFYGEPSEVFKHILAQKDVRSVHCNHDYEPAAIKRDQLVRELCQNHQAEFFSYKDQVIFEKGEVLSETKKPYTVFTPYKKKWLAQLNSFYLKSYPTESYFSNLAIVKRATPMIVDLKDMGFNENLSFDFPESEVSPTLLKNYAEKRDFPGVNGTSRLGLHLRFGTLSVRHLVKLAQKHSEVWLSELIWREFFMQILYHFPKVEKQSFRSEYDQIAWRESQTDFEKWCQGQTGYPMIDAGMRELVQTGFMHNRVRMVVASFLTKHLLIHWSKGERFFAKHLLDYELAANNGNWQWSAGTGCDAAPYFRIFNPETQTKRFDPDLIYIKKWVPELGTAQYVKPMVEHSFARGRALSEFSKGLKK